MTSGASNAAAVTAEIKSFSAVPFLLALELSLDSGEPMRDYHRLAFDYADDHGRLRMALEAMVVAGSEASSDVRRMVETCLYKRPHPSIAAQAVLRLSALRHRLLTLDAAERFFRDTHATPEDRRLVHGHFYPHQILGYSPRCPDGDRCLRIWGTPDTERPSLFDQALSIWDAGADPRLRLSDLVFLSRSLRTDYLRFRTSLEVTARASRTCDVDCLEFLLDTAGGDLSVHRRKDWTPYMLKRHRRAGLAGAVGLAFLAIGQRQRAREIRDRILAQWVEETGWKPAERLASSICASANGTRGLRMLARHLHPGPASQRDADAESTLQSVLAQQAGRLARREYRFLKHSLHRVGVGNRTTSRSRRYDREWNVRQDDAALTGLGAWIRAIQRLRAGEETAALDLLERGWTTSADLPPDTVYRAALAVMQALEFNSASGNELTERPTGDVQRLTGVKSRSQLPNRSLVNFHQLFVDRFRRFRGIEHTDDTGPIEALRIEIREAVSRATLALLRPLDPVANATNDVGEIRRTWQKKNCRIVEGTRRSEVVKPDPGGLEANVLRSLAIVPRMPAPAIVGSSPVSLITEYVNGAPLAELTGTSREEGLRSVARSLAFLHGGSWTFPQWFCPRRPRDRPAPIGVEELAEAAAQIVPAAQVLLRDYDAKLASEPAVFVHGDLHLANVVITEDGKAVFVDWEDAELGRREDDLGCFCAGLADSEKATFLAAYRECAQDDEIHMDAVEVAERRTRAYGEVWRLTYLYLESAGG